eukprot:TRINITY_DN706_c0_g1_i3.p1 TRINITY_DN706_c0_g1~~TRINITY_DN706_c0_g1_i3.p1  ORF type:complete len:491 (+),score=46.75 TRINITY_DN706_c0_g1_i3:407-1879(+)
MILHDDEKLDISDFYSKFTEDSGDIESALNLCIQARNERKPFPFRQFYTYVFPRIVRNQSIDDFIERIKAEANFNHFPFDSKKLLIQVLITNSTPTLQVILLNILMQYSPIPIVNVKLESLGTRSKPQYDFLSSFYWVFKPLPSLLVIAVGDDQNHNHNKRINSLFGTRFEEIVTHFDQGSIDIQYDYDFKDPKRGFSVVRTDEFVDSTKLDAFIQFCGMYMFIIPADHLHDNNIKSIEALYDQISVHKASKGIQDFPFFVLVTDDLNYKKTPCADTPAFGFRRDKIQLFSLPNEQNDPRFFGVAFKKIHDDLKAKVDAFSRGPGLQDQVNHKQMLQLFNLQHLCEDEKQIEELMNEIQIAGDGGENGFYCEQFLPMYSLFVQECQTYKEILTNDGTKNEKKKDLEEKLVIISNQMRDREITKRNKISNLFLRMMIKPNSYILYFSLARRLQDFVSKRTKDDIKLYFSLNQEYHKPVSYTHLTLPTIYSV